MRIKDCVFCQIIERQIPSKIFFENDYNLAFLDIYPVSKGHSIVIPKNHYANLEEIPDEELSRLYRDIKKIARLIHKKLNLDGYNILQNNFKAAGQVINHFHVHIIPRNENDARFSMKIPRNQANDKDLDEVLEIIKY
ncbi:MAG: HIT family protein [Candidatus Thorarchaeota archaeon]